MLAKLSLISNESIVAKKSKITMALGSDKNSLLDENRLTRQALRVKGKRPRDTAVRGKGPQDMEGGEDLTHGRETWSTRSRDRRRATPCHTVRAGCHTAGVGAEEPADQRGDPRGDQGGAVGVGRETGALGQGILSGEKIFDTILRPASETDPRTQPMRNRRGGNGANC